MQDMHKNYHTGLDYDEKVWQQMHIFLSPDKCSSKFIKESPFRIWYHFRSHRFHFFKFIFCVFQPIFSIVRIRVCGCSE